MCAAAILKNMSHTSARARGTRAGLLRELAGAPLSEWPQALEQCLATLSEIAVADDYASLREKKPTVAANRRVRSWPLSPLVRRICALIRAHYDERISIGSLAARVGRNPAYTAALFHRQTGTTIHRYVTRIRMRRAATLLRRSEKVEAVMLQVGYRSKKNFYRQFAMAFGITPGEYKAGTGCSRLRDRAPLAIGA
jgi:AraC-like DNA-binding protein